MFLYNYCGACKKLSDRVGYYCSSCNGKRKKTAQPRVKKNKEKGLCGVCGKQRDREGYYCTVCRDKHKGYTKAYRERQKLNKAK